MSYSISVSGVSAQEIEDKLNEALEKEKTNANLSDEAVEQAQTGIEAAMAVIESGAIGEGGTAKTPGVNFTVSISGHANPGHKAADGMANDMLNVSVYQHTAAPLV